MSKKIAVIVGSIRRNSLSGTLANNLVKLFPADYQIEFIKIDDLPLYSQDYDADGSPAEYIRFRDAVKSADAVLFVTPEHNRSFPTALKNALDIGSRPYGQSVWNGKPALIVSQSPGNLSGFGANHHLRQVLAFLNMPVVQQPEAYIGSSYTLFDDAGNLNSEETKGFLQTIIDAFVDLIGRYA